MSYNKFRQNNIVDCMPNEKWVSPEQVAEAMGLTSKSDVRFIQKQLLKMARGRWYLVRKKFQKEEYMAFEECERYLAPNGEKLPPGRVIRVSS